MRVLQLEVKDILSLGDVTLEFGDNGLVLVEGWNHDDNKANGAGKTAIFNALSWAIFGKVPRRITASEILRHGAKTGYSQVTLSSRGVEWVVRRERPNRVVFRRAGTAQQISQEEFESSIGLNYNQFLISMYSSQTEGRKFLTLNDSGKKEFLLQLLNMDRFADAKKLIDEQLKKLDKERASIESQITALSSAFDTYCESLTDEAAVNASISLANNQIQDLTAQIKELEKVKKPDLTKYDDLEKKIKDKRASYSELRAQRKLVNSEIAKIKSKISDLSKVKLEPDALCPYCNKGVDIVGHKLHRAGDEVESAKAVEAQRAELNSQLTANLLESNKLDEELSKESQLDEVERKLKSQRNTAFADYNTAISQISDIKEKISYAKMRILGLQEKLEGNAQLREKIQATTVKLESAKITRYGINNKIQELEAVSAVFSPTGAPAYIMDSMVDALNDEIAHYIDLLWPNARYVLRSYRENSQGDTVAKFSEELTVNGKEKSIGSLSGGELRCLSIIIDLSLIEILSKRYSIDLNPIILDEPFEGLDSSSREQVIEILDKMSANRQIWVVDHASEAKAMFSKVVLVEKRNDCSSIAVGS